MNKAMNGISADLTCNQQELEKWLDETSVPLSDDDIRQMSAYFQYEESNLCDIINIDKQNT